MSASKIYKENEVLFSTGDTSDGMYLVRTGELKIYLEEDGNEVQLATVGAGGMIGEMAFFEDKPRSASVKAMKTSEVTKISNEDFEKLIKQIPKWFVSIMTGLSSRLRQTNERLQKLEQTGGGVLDRYERLIQSFHIIELLSHKYGTKDKKEILLPRNKVEEELQIIGRVDAEKIQKLISIMAKMHLLAIKKDSHNTEILVLKNIAQLRIFTDFITEFRKDYPDTSSLPDTALHIIQHAYDIAKDSPYEKTTVSMKNIIERASPQHPDTDTWSSSLKLFKAAKPFFQLVRVTADDMGFRIIHKDLEPYLHHHRILSEFHKAGLDR